MKLDENKDKKISIRLKSEDYEYLQAVSYMSGMTVSRYIRMMVDASVNAVKIGVKEGKVNIENIKAVLNDKL